jgi:hypothetical protein
MWASVTIVVAILVVVMPIVIAMAAIAVVKIMFSIEGSDMDPPLVRIAASDAIVGLLDAVHDHPSAVRAAETAALPELRTPADFGFNDDRRRRIGGLHHDGLRLNNRNAACELRMLRHAQ